ncbi:NUDIX domain-containing protein [Paracoccus tibetensis]|uniref:ADP-ribose pyrophosphatase n=1 Tax=Paracoccus tibetensis TaxID=336292 RepID=A0A1G5H361_9RHOB|nr:NUDIX domain-containing protein [Paracoccus tibetensis]SCY57348.1 nudix-type nucleoside diphosphatase, YffH/AdpP family [Paracoccus tibetensis]
MSLLLVGLLARPEMLAALDLQGVPATLKGRLQGGARAGIDAGGWPRLADGPEALPAVQVGANAALARYAEVMGVPEREVNGRRVLGASAGPRAEGAGAPLPQQARLAAEIARQILKAPAGLPAAELAGRLPMIGTWAASRLRAAAGAASGGEIVRRRAADEVELHDDAEPFTGYFALRRPILRHSRHDGGCSPRLSREVFMMGDAVVVLPWDPRRDRVLLIEQFRAAPLLRADPQPWMLEAVAGRVDAGETPEEAANREAREEADLALSRLIPVLGTYPSPGAVGEFHYHYVGIADLPDGTGGIHGLAEEAEDIRGHLLPRHRLEEMVLAGQIPNGPLAMIVLWLRAEAEQLRKALEP